MSVWTTPIIATMIQQIVSIALEVSCVIAERDLVTGWTQQHVEWRVSRSWYVHIITHMSQCDVQQKISTPSMYPSMSRFHWFYIRLAQFILLTFNYMKLEFVSHWKTRNFEQTLAMNHIITWSSYHIMDSFFVYCTKTGNNFFTEHWIYYNFLWEW